MKKISKILIGLATLSLVLVGCNKKTDPIPSPEPNKYTVVFNSNGGSPVESITVNEGETINKPVNPTRDGYTFVNWFEEEALVKAFDFSTKITKNWTLYAGWEEIVVPPEPTKYTITFNSNGGSAVNPITVNEGETINKPANPTRDGYTFTNWFKEAALTNPFDFSTPITKDWTLYAGWQEVVPPEPTKYTVNFYNYDSSLLYSVEVEEHEDAVYKGVSPTRPDDSTYTYSFTGWDKSFLDVTENINTIAQYERFFVKTTKVIAIGDAHVCSDEVSQQHLAKTLEYVKENNIDVVLFNGDTIDVAIDENYTIVDGILEDAFGDVSEEDRPTFVFTMGNHEFYPSGTCRHQETDWNREFNKFRTFANKWATYQIKENENVYSQVINGITYICAFPGSDANYIENEETIYTAGLGGFSNTDLEKLEDKLDEANALDNTKPIIVMTHWPWGETYGGPNYGVGSESEVAKMKAVLGKYPQVVNLTSHTHFSNLHDRDIGQSTYTTINVGMHCYGKYVSNCELDENDEVINYANIENRRVDSDSQAVKYHGKTHFGLQLAFSRDELTVDRVNFANESIYSHGTFVIPYNITKNNLNDKFLYTSDKRSGPEFTFSGDDSLVVTTSERKNKISVDIAFKDADQYYAAEGYKVVLEDENNQELYSIKWASLFWADLGQRNTYSLKTTLNGGLTNFVAKLYPIDFYGHYGDPLSINVEVEPNAYVEQEAKEVAVGDLFFASSIAKTQLDSEHMELDTYCLDTVNSASGLSYKISGDSEAEGWPTIRISLDQAQDLSNASLTFSAKYFAKDVAAKKWLAIVLYDSDGNQITSEVGKDFSGSDNAWLSCLMTNSKLVSNLIDGYDLSDVKLIKFIFNFSENKGHNQIIWLDELHLAEVPTTQNNLEMVEMDDGMCSGTTASITYTDVYGDSVSARKFTFENSDLSKAYGRPRVTFSPDHSGLSNIDVYNTTMSLDIKLSPEFFDNDNAEKHTFVLKIYSSWTDSENTLNVYNFFPNGAAGFYPENTDNGWIHLEQNMHISIYENLKPNSLIRMEFQFFGLDETTKMTAWVVIDNITFTPNA